MHTQSHATHHVTSSSSTDDDLVNDILSGKLPYASASDEQQSAFFEGAVQKFCARMVDIARFVHDHRAHGAMPNVRSVEEIALRFRSIMTIDLLKNFRGKSVNLHLSPDTSPDFEDILSWFFEVTALGLAIGSGDFQTDDGETIQLRYNGTAFTLKIAERPEPEHVIRLFF